MFDSIIEQIIKTIFGSDWVIPAIIFLVAIFVIKLIHIKKFPKYFRICIDICVVSVAFLVVSHFFTWNKYQNVQFFLRQIVHFAMIPLFLGIFAINYLKIHKSLKQVLKNTKSDGNKITAWKELQNIKVDNLTPRQKKDYSKRRLYLRVFLGNMCGAEQELEQYNDDKPFYHYMRAIILCFKGNHKAELEETKFAEDCCTGDTDSFLRLQIIVNRGVGYIGAGEYNLADDCFKKAITYGKENNLDNAELWLNIYYNYVFNKTRINPQVSIQECLDILEDVKEYIDIEDPKQYIIYSNTVIELLRQKKAERTQIDEVINKDFEYLINQNLPDTERCILEASTARMVCTGRLNPEIVLDRLSKDIELFLKLPMPEKYRCLKEIDYMFKDLRGPIVDKYKNVKETAHGYITSWAISDLENYRGNLPSEAVYEICYCLKEQAGILKYNPSQYSWKSFQNTMHSAQMLYTQNELLADSVLCSLDTMNEAIAEFNLDSELKPIYLNEMQILLQDIEKNLPQMLEHPILNEIYLRLSYYCYAMNVIEKSKDYYVKLQSLGNFSIDHFAPWLRGYYFLISLFIFVISYIEAVDNIAGKDLEKESPLVQDWFKNFHNRNGYYESIVLGRLLGREILPIQLDLTPAEQSQNDIKSAYLVILPLQVKIKSNGYLSEKLFSEYHNTELHYCNINLLMPDMRTAIEDIVSIIKFEMPDYLITGKEFDRLVE